LFWDKSFEELHSNVDQTPEYERQRVVRSSLRISNLSAPLWGEGLTLELCQIFNNDLVRTVKLSAFIKEMLAKAQAACGPQNFISLYASKMDATVSDQLTKLLEA